MTVSRSGGDASPGSVSTLARWGLVWSTGTAVGSIGFCSCVRCPLFFDSCIGFLFWMGYVGGVPLACFGM